MRNTKETYARDYAIKVWKEGKPHIRKEMYKRSFMPPKMVWVCIGNTTFFVGRGETMQEAYDNFLTGDRIWTRKKPA